MSWELWSPGIWSWPFAEMESWADAFAPKRGAAAGHEPQWATPNQLSLELAALRLRDFSKADGQPVVVVSPFALHDAQLADIAQGHSLIAALQANGCARIYLVEWRSAGPETKLGTIDSQLAALNVAIDDIGAPADIVGLCQGGWLSLLYAARFPGKVRKLVLAGVAVDTRAEASALTRPIDATPDPAIDHLIRCGDGIVRGRLMAALWPREASQEKRIVDALEIATPFLSNEALDAVAAFNAWDERPLDLPGPYFRQVVKWLYRENRLARGDFPALGRLLKPRDLKCPLFVLAGAADTVAPPAQAFAAAELVGGEVSTALAPCGHLALFMGLNTLRNEWLEIARWLREE
ncbi:MAG: poly(3-hydroxyalkanoate) synthetase [Methylocystis sp.]|nr:MAG: poly(3-hydroxyalkanoate) synthetase [Methylocystis sp.]